MMLLLTIFWIISIIYQLFFLASLVYAILYGLEKLGLIMEDNKFYISIMTLLDKILAPLLNIVRKMVTLSTPYDLSPFILLIVLYMVPIILVQFLAIVGMNMASVVIK